VFEELHVDRTTRELGDGAALNTDERQGIEDKNGKMLNGNATSMHRQLDAQSPEQIFNRAPILDGAIENGFHFLEYVARFEYRDTRAEVASSGGHRNPQHLGRRAGMQQRQREDGRSSGESSISGRVIEIHVESRKQRLEGEERSRLTSVDEQLLDRQLLAADVGADLKALLKGLSGRDESRLVRHEKRFLRIVGIHLDDEAVGGNALYQLGFLSPIAELQTSSDDVALDADHISESLLLQLLRLRKQDFQLQREAESMQYVVQVVQGLSGLVKTSLEQLMQALSHRRSPCHRRESPRPEASKGSWQCRP